MSGAVYLLCAATSGLCAALLLRHYARSGQRLLLWSGLCFVGLAVENVVLFVDLIVLTEVDLLLVRLAVALSGLALLLFGLVWDAR
jgi:hypothetical protein